MGTTFLLVLIGVTLGLSGDCLFKQDRQLWLGFLLYAASGIPVWLSYRRGTWMEVALYWSVLAISVSAALGVTVFHERLAARQWIAFVMALVAALLWNS